MLPPPHTRWQPKYLSWVQNLIEQVVYILSQRITRTWFVDSELNALPPWFQWALKSINTLIQRLCNCISGVAGTKWFPYSLDYFDDGLESVKGYYVQVCSHRQLFRSVLFLPRTFYEITTKLHLNWVANSSVSWEMIAEHLTYFGLFFLTQRIPFDHRYITIQ